MTRSPSHLASHSPTRSPLPARNSRCCACRSSARNGLPLCSGGWLPIGLTAVISQALFQRGCNGHPEKTLSPQRDRGFSRAMLTGGESVCLKSLQLRPLGSPRCGCGDNAFARLDALFQLAAEAEGGGAKGRQGAGDGGGLSPCCTMPKNDGASC